MRSAPKCLRGCHVILSDRWRAERDVTKDMFDGGDRCLPCTSLLLKY